MKQLTMPRLSDTMQEGAISSWHKKVGDRVEVGDTLAEIESDKATMDFEAYEAGTLTAILVPEGESVVIGTPIAELDGEPGGSGSASGSPSEASAPAGASAPATASAVEAAAPAGAAGVSSPERLLASPVVRALAREHGIDLRTITGTGPGGRIIRADVEQLTRGPGSRAGRAGSAPAAATSPAAEPEPVAAAEPVAATGPAPVAPAPLDERRGTERVPIDSVRRVIARRLAEASRSIPHFAVTAVADAEELVALRASLNERLTAAGRARVSVNDLLVRAAALALREHPRVNASYPDDDSAQLQLHHRINIGIAVASDHGLVVPVLDDADTKSVGRLAEESKALVELAQSHRLTPAQMSGGTFTISNLGMYGVEEFTAIINPPEGAILSVGAIALEPAVVDGRVQPRHRIRCTLNSDHRIIDGALAAQWLQTLTRLIEDPWTILA